MTKTEEGDQDVASVGDGLLARTETPSTSGSASSSGEGQSLADSEVGQMVVIFGKVSNVARVVVPHLLGRSTVVADLTLDGGESLGVVGEGLEKTGASGTGTTEYEKHLSGLDGSSEVVQDVFADRVALGLDRGGDLSEASEDGAEGGSVGDAVVKERIRKLLVFLPSTS